MRPAARNGVRELLNGRIAGLLMIGYDLAMALPALCCLALSAFVWDDPRPQPLLLQAGRIAMTVALVAQPFCLAANFAACVRGMRHRVRPGLREWVLLFPSLVIWGIAIWFIAG